jgi:hypothetical protein
MLPNSRKNAIKLNSKYYFTNKPCKNGHLAERYTSCGVCKICGKTPYNKEYKDKYYKENTDKYKKYTKKYREKNKEKLAKYKKDNRGKFTALEVRRYCYKIKRTPKWLTKKDFIEIENIYIKAKEKSKLYKEQYHVDHIIPLNGKYVSGLHIQSNLQIIKASENLSKSNKYSRELQL